MRVLVVGAAGQLGGDVCHALATRGHEVLAASRRDSHVNLDITDASAVAHALDSHRPGAVVNCAAWTRVDAAEDRSDDAYRVNAMGPRLLAAACDRTGTHLLHVSTDFVFDGTGSAPIDEWDPAHPLGVYGASKLAGEREVRALCRRHQIVRTAWLYGRQGPNFVLTILRLARQRGELQVVADQTGSPTWTGHLAPALVALLEAGVPGTYHLTNAGAATWHEFATEIVREAGLHHVSVVPLTTAQFPTAARRPAYSVLDNRAWRLLGNSPLPPWRDGLRRYLADLAPPAAS